MEYLINNVLKSGKSGEKVQIIEWNWRTGSVESIINIFLLLLFFLASALVTIDSGLQLLRIWVGARKQRQGRMRASRSCCSLQKPRGPLGLQPLLSSCVLPGFISLHYAELTFASSMSVPVFCRRSAWVCNNSLGSGSFWIAFRNLVCITGPLWRYFCCWSFACYLDSDESSFCFRQCTKHYAHPRSG